MDITYRTNQELIEAHVTIVKTLDELSKEVHVIEQELFARMTENNATVIDHVTHEATLVRTPQVDRSKLYPLAEIVPPEVLAKGFTPQHEETTTTIVPDKWNMQQVKTWKKYGKEAQEIIDNATTLGPPRLVIKAKK